ncbi:MAG TPA: Flp family type IVb pilin [Planctomycetaceae bacterium]|nr:Flp family type IVb pilin [Planctomycetaceae bacterium]
MNRLRQLWVSEDGVAAVEYALLLTFIVVGIVGTLNAIGIGIHNIYVIISGSLP